MCETQNLFSYLHPFCHFYSLYSDLVPLCDVLSRALVEGNADAVRQAVSCTASLLKFTFSIMYANLVLTPNISVSHIFVCIYTREHPIPIELHTQADYEALNRALISLLKATFSVRSTALSIRVLMLRLSELLVCLAAPRSHVVRRQLFLSRDSWFFHTHAIAGQDYVSGQSC